VLVIPFASSANLKFVNSDTDGWEMSTEDLDAWDATLQSCLEYVLDEGADVTRVLDHVAGTIASTHIPTGASATRAADILLGHLEASLSSHPHDAALALLLAFVNDTLVSTYPPEPQDKVVSMWLLRTVKKIVGTLPPRMLREVVGALQEGLGVWVADQYQVFTMEEYAFDVGGFLFFFRFSPFTHAWSPTLTVLLDCSGVPDNDAVLAVSRPIHRYSQSFRSAVGIRVYWSRGQTAGYG
jgi:hypothetical protein